MARRVRQYDDIVAGPLAPDGSLRSCADAHSFKAWTRGRKTNGEISQ
jgi:hypothetical protein